jgi:hypothetical protein
VDEECTSVAEEEDASEPSEGSPLDVFCVLERPLAAGAPLPVDEARVLFRRVLAALRLCGAGGTGLGPLAWAQAGGGAWHPVALGASPRVRRQPWELRASDESELRELLEVLSKSRHGASVAWALDRFEMGCERGLETEALSDHLLALRALFAAPGGDPAEVAQRVAVVCAVEPERAAVREQVELAFALERQLILRGLDYGEALSLDSPRRVVREVERVLRALLRDVLCGYLHEDLSHVADEALARAGSAPQEEPLIRDARTENDTEELAVTPSVDWAAASG